MADQVALKNELITTQSLVYKLELEREMNQLYSIFNQWKNDEIDVHDLAAKIRSEYNIAAKELYLKYELASFADINVAQAIIDGIITKESLSPALIKLIEPKIKVLQKNDK